MRWDKGEKGEDNRKRNYGGGRKKCLFIEQSVIFFIIQLHLFITWTSVSLCFLSDHTPATQISNNYGNRLIVEAIYQQINENGKCLLVPAYEIRGCCWSDKTITFRTSQMALGSYDDDFFHQFTFCRTTDLPINWQNNLQIMLIIKTIISCSPQHILHFQNESNIWSYSIQHALHTSVITSHQ